MSGWGRWRAWHRRFWRSTDGSSTVEFVIIVPFLLSIFLLSVDAGIMQLRHVFLHRAVEQTVREVRLGQVSEEDRMSSLICERAAMLPNCGSKIAVEMRPVDTSNFTGLERRSNCIRDEDAITPAVTFTPGAGGMAQELMLVRVCVTVEPFIRWTGVALALPVNPTGNFVLNVSSVFVNEPR
ncbi:MAG: pilus assembly protein [Roseinatronobacter sp.]|nr:pilus assembly protein [Roseinatronobacter sp.]